MFVIFSKSTNYLLNPQSKKQEEISNLNNKEKITFLESNNKSNKVLAYLTIFKIGIKESQVVEGVNSDVINYTIGHFPNTPTIYGNVGLAAHNDGVEGANFFKDLDKLVIGDEILYQVGDILNKYEVKRKIVIDSHDWSYLENTGTNTLTLITCVSNNDKQRLCIQAEEKIKEF